MTTRQDCAALDAADPLAALRDAFLLPDDVIYLDGNSLGVLPKSVPARLDHVIRHEWGTDLIRSWNTAGWIDLPHRIGNKIARLVGAGDDELVVGDSTSVNLYKVLSAAAMLVRADGGASSRRVILSERSNFPTDLYIADSVAKAHGFELQLIEADEIGTRLDDERVAILMLTHVNYRSGRMHDMAAISRAAHCAGALVVWDLCHSAGAVPVNLCPSRAGEDAGADADFAVGCGYKYLNGGPGAPAFAWAHPRHTARMDREQWRQPLSGWLGHAAPFAFTPDYQPAAGIARFVCGTPPVLAMAALECGVDVFAQTDAFGGIAALRAKSLALTSLFIELVEARCAGFGLELATPRTHELRGSQVSFARADGAYAVMQALIGRHVIGDFRAGDPSAAVPSPDLLRFGFAPLYTRFVDVWDAADHLCAVLDSGEWREARFAARSAVT